MEMKLKIQRDAFSRSEIDFLNRNKVGRLATVSYDCRPFVTPVTFALSKNGDEIYIPTEPRNQKVRNIRANSNVAFVVDEFPDFWKNSAVVVRGSASLLDSSEKKRQYMLSVNLLKAKYNEFKTALAPTDVIIAIEPKSITSWGIKRREILDRKERGEPSHKKTSTRGKV
jgi:nitroimidazol reductase NimA-like FMN-containing flavoprotein (pyridoxamine 5'-phosphate oxidase superfamily)